MTERPVLLLGASGWVGGMFARALERRGIESVPASRKSQRYDEFGALLELLRRVGPRFLINAAGFTGKPNVDACEDARGETLRGNVLLPVTIAHACAVTQTPWAHVSSGCLYSGAKLALDGTTRVEKDLLGEAARSALARGARIEGFSEDDAPNFSFDAPPSSFYSGSKALAERALADAPGLYVFRMRLPFDEHHGPRNLLTKLLTYPKLYENLNSLTHLGHYVEACLDLWQRGAPFGTYNLTNPGFVSTREIADLVKRHIAPHREFEFWESDAAFYAKAVRALRSNCVLDASKAVAAGARLPPVREALEEALSRWDGPR